MTDAQGRLDFDAGDPAEVRDAQARALAVDPTRNVALEASAGTGKTRVLVDRYVGLVLAGVKPRHILAITFTRKAAAEMRQRILRDLARRQRDHTIPAGLWQEIRDGLPEIGIATIDAFCLSLLREFPLEADVDPGFELADETETPRLVNEALDRTLRLGRAFAADEPELALLFTELGEFRLREGLARLIDRRLVAWPALNRFISRSPAVTIDQSVANLLARLRAAFASVPRGLAGFLDSGPRTEAFALATADLRRLLSEPAPDAATTQALLERVRDHLLTQDGEPRKRLTARKAEFRSPADYERHVAAVSALAPYLADALQAYRDDINRVLARAVRRLFAVGLDQYRRTLAKHGVLDFSDVLQRALGLLAQMDEFSRSRFKLESRYQHVLVDEFQDTSRAQWALVELLVRAWAAGRGVSDQALEPTIFIVGDRKQSIYGFRDAEVAVLDEAARFIDGLRPVGQVRTAITRSFRAVRELLLFVNDVGAAIDKVPERADAFRYGADDLFPVTSVEAAEPDALGLVAAASEARQADAVAGEIAALLRSGAAVRDRETGLRRAIRPGDVAILFRTRDGHRLIEDALARRHVPFYVYKGLGFFDADEIKDVLALLTFLSRPESELSAAAFLRSRFVRLSDDALKRLAPQLSAAVSGVGDSTRLDALHPGDRRRLALARAAVPQWLTLVDRLPPSELLDRVLAESGYAAEIGGPAGRQARENLKKIRGVVRRIQNRGYATLGRIVDHFAQLVAGGDESNAILDAVDAVNLMTVHAAKGLEFPVVFIVNMNRGSGGSPDAIRVVAPAAVMTGDEEPVAATEASVAIGGHRSASDRDLDAREAEEAKRLLYVALTRARDRLYLAAVLAPDGRFAPGKGGLGRTLPATLGAIFAGAAAHREVTWSGPGTAHRFRVVEPMAEEPETSEAAGDPGPGLDDFAVLAVAGPGRQTVTADTGSEESASVLDRTAGSSTATLGVIVHRAIDVQLLFAPRGARFDAALVSLLRDEDRALVDDVETVVGRTRELLDRLSQHPDVVALLADPRDIVWVGHEVPFSLLRDGAVIRGSIDLVVQRNDRVVVLEIKTGRPLPAHQAQLALYLDAARALFPDASVEGQVVYASLADASQLSVPPGV